MTFVKLLKLKKRGKFSIKPELISLASKEKNILNDIFNFPINVLGLFLVSIYNIITKINVKCLFVLAPNCFNWGEDLTATGNCSLYTDDDQKTLKQEDYF